MTAHPSRAGAISAELFAAICDGLMSTSCADRTASYDCVPSRDYLKHRIMDAALAIAVRRAARKFGWVSDFHPSLEVDLAGYIQGWPATSPQSKPRSQKDWVEAEIAKISRKALAALEGVS